MASTNPKIAHLEGCIAFLENEIATGWTTRCVARAAISHYLREIANEYSEATVFRTTTERQPYALAALVFGLRAELV